jgi:peptidoglycan hydrolase CwlO-like protein
MISSDKYRAGINITLSDIFADFNDSRKEVLIKRVKIALEDLEIRMRNEVETNNLANLQMLLKKQQAVKKMEEKVKEMIEEIEEKRERDNYLNSKIAELQNELKKNADTIHPMQEKIKTLNESINQK